MLTSQFVRVVPPSKPLLTYVILNIQIQEEHFTVYLVAPAKKMALNIFYLKRGGGIWVYWEIKPQNKYSWKILRQEKKSTYCSLQYGMPPYFENIQPFIVKLVIPLKQKLSGTSDIALSGTFNI